MRITTQAMFSQYNANIQNLMNSLDQTEEQIGTGLKLNEPSDNPAVVAEITTEKAQLSSIAGYQTACTDATTLLNATNTALSSMSSLISSAQEIGNAAASGSTSAQSTDASELNNIIQSTIGIANTQVGDTYIFSGYGTNNPAVDADGTLNATATANNISMQINTGTSVNVNVTAAGLIAYNTTATSASSPNSGLITDTGAFTAPNDIFSANGGTLAITLNGGAASTVTIPANATLSQVSDAINAANTGVRAAVINANGTGTPADYRIMLSSASASPADAITVAVTSTDAAGSGLNTLSVSSGVGAKVTSVVSPDTTVIGAMSILQTAIEQGDSAAIQTALTALNSVSASVLSTQSNVGASIGMINQASQNLTSQNTEVTSTLSGQLVLSSTDIAALSAEQQQQQTSLQSLESISTSFLNTNLFDFLFPASSSS